MIYNSWTIIMIKKWKMIPCFFPLFLPEPEKNKRTQRIRNRLFTLTGLKRWQLQEALELTWKAAHIVIPPPPAFFESVFKFVSSDYLSSKIFGSFFGRLRRFGRVSDLWSVGVLTLIPSSSSVKRSRKRVLFLCRICASPSSSSICNLSRTKLCQEIFKNW